MVDLHEDFLRRYTAAQQPIFAYIRSKGFDLADAEDVLQDVSVALWESIASYQPSRPFLGWALGVARNLIHKHQRRQRIRRHTQVDPALLDRISQEVAQTLSRLEGDLADERDRMEQCMKALPEKAKAILALRY